MDGIKTRELAARLKDNLFAGYRVLELLNHGKSAAVFKAQDATGGLCALKVFDDDLVEKFGAQIQIDRIEKEISLKNHGIANLVSILDGGQTSFDGRDHYYIVMEYIEGKNILQYYCSETYEVSFILGVLETLYQVSEHLLTRFRIAHRDIKAENVMVATNGQIVLMDLGVLKIIDQPTITDVAKKEFLGTLRYGPPEFITRHEENTPEGWRAINLYQIGGVLHDLLLKKELFSGVEPYGELINVILHLPPVLNAAGFPFSLVQLTRDLLAKDWQARLRLCTPEKIAAVISQSGANGNLNSEIESIFFQADKTIQLSEEVDRRKRTVHEKEKLKRQVSNKLHQSVRQSMDDLSERKLTNQVNELPIHMPIHFQMRSSIATVPSQNVVYADPGREGDSDRSIVYILQGDIKLGYFLPIHLLVRIQNDEQSSCSISMAAITRNEEPAQLMAEPSGYFVYLANKLGQSDPPLSGNKVLWLPMLDIFTGTVEFGDSFQQYLTTQTARLLRLCLKAMLPYSERVLSGERVDKKNFQPIIINRWQDG